MHESFVIVTILRYNYTTTRQNGQVIKCVIIIYERWIKSIKDKDWPCKSSMTHCIILPMNTSSAVPPWDMEGNVFKNAPLVPSDVRPFPTITNILFEGMLCSTWPSCILVHVCPKLPETMYFLPEKGAPAQPSAPPRTPLWILPHRRNDSFTLCNAKTYSIVIKNENRGFQVSTTHIFIIHFCAEKNNDGTLMNY